MNRKFEITLTRGEAMASYLITYSENEHPLVVKSTGDDTTFIREDGSAVSFAATHMDKLAAVVQELAAELGAEGFIEEVTGKREFQIRLQGKDFNADFTVIYHPGNAIPVVTSSAGNPDIPLPDGSTVPFSKVSAADLKSFVASMAKTNGLNFEFVDLDE
ncbi:MAG: hypothetical protein V4689_05035 [Verrucomicrobiota bacterium]